MNKFAEAGLSYWSFITGLADIFLFWYVLLTPYIP